MEHRSRGQDEAPPRLVDRVAFANRVECEPHLIDAGTHGEVAKDVSFRNVEHVVYGTLLALKLARLKEMGSYCILYDADCGICTRAATWLQQRALQEPVRWVPVNSPEAHNLLPNRPPDEMAVIAPQGEVWLGADGVTVCLQLAGHRALARTLGLPLGRQLGQAAYRVIARNRRLLSRWFGLPVCRA